VHCHTCTVQYNDERFLETDFARHAPIIREMRVSVLEERLTSLLAEELGVPPETVTPAFVQRWREEHIYPHVTFDFSTRYGGYNPVRTIVPTREEIEENSKRAKNFWEKRAAAAAR
jgi:hypothetical protein